MARRNSLKSIVPLLSVEGAEDVVAELLGVATGEEELVHVDELGRAERAVGTVLAEALVPLLDGGLVVPRVSLEELHVLLAQRVLLACDTTHNALSLTGGVALVLPCIDPADTLGRI